MSLTQSTLAAELESMIPVDNEPAGIDNFATAFSNYFLESTVNGVDIEDETLLQPAIAAMKTAMVGVSSTGSVSIAAGISAFWGAIPALAATLWILVPPLTSATVPPGLGGLGAAIQAAGVANITGKLSLEDSAAAMAAAIHPLNIGGVGIVTATPPVSFPIS